MNPEEEEQLRRDEEARRAVLEELASGSLERGITGRDDDEEPAAVPFGGNRRFTGDFEPAARERIARVHRETATPEGRAAVWQATRAAGTAPDLSPLDALAQGDDVPPARPGEAAQAMQDAQIARTAPTAGTDPIARTAPAARVDPQMRRERGADLGEPGSSSETPVRLRRPRGLALSSPTSGTEYVTHGPRPVTAQLASVLGDPTRASPTVSGSPVKPAAPPTAPGEPDHIPTEGDIASARDRDIPNRIRHGLANALRVLGGRSPVRELHGEEERLTALAERMRGEKRQSRLDERAEAEAAAERESEAASREQAAQSRALQERALQARIGRDEAQMGLATRSADRLDRQTDSTIATQAEQTAGRAQDRTQEAALRTHGTPESTTEIERVRALLDSISNRSEASHRVIAPLMARLDAADATGETAAEIERSPLLRSLMESLRRSGRGGAGGRQAERTADLEVIARDLVATGQAPDMETGLALARQGTRGAVGGLMQAHADESRERIPGWTRTADAPRLGARSADAREIATADDEFERAIARIERVSQRLGPTARLEALVGAAPQDYRELEHSLEVIRTQLRRINDAGSSLGAQHQAEVSIPGLTQVPTVQALLNNIRAAYAVKHDYVVAAMRSAGYERERGGAAHGDAGGGGGSAAVPAASGARVPIILAEPIERGGRRTDRVTLPESQVAAFLAAHPDARRAE